MKYFFTVFILLLIATSCQNENKNLAAEKEAMRKDSVFKSISKNWNFSIPQTNNEVENTLKEWNQWLQFQNELKQKPKTSISAFINKIEKLTKQADSLPLSVPERFNNPQVRSRLITLDTQLNSLKTYMNLQEIPQEKVIELIQVVNNEITSVYDQLEEVVIKEKIPIEIGEADMIRALDTTRLANKKLFEENLKKIDSASVPSQPEPNRKPLLNQFTRE